MNLGGLTTPIAFLIVLGLAVLLHELGHFIAAKAVGVRVLEFAFGFPPKLFTLFRRNGTDYVVCALPIGGYVKLAGMEPGEEAGEDGFNTKPVWKRVVVYAAGPFMNFVLAAIIFIGIGTTVGVPANPDRPDAEIQAVTQGAPAEAAGFQAGDRILKINGDRLDYEGVLDRVRENPGKEIVVAVRREGSEVSLPVTPAAKEDGKGQIGVVLGAGFDYRRVGIVGATAYGAGETWRFTRDTFLGLGRLFTDSSARRQVGGPVAIARLAGSAFREGLLTFLKFLAIISVNLGVLNLLPLLVVDGGQIAFLALEWIRGRKLQPQLQLSIQVVGMVLILLAMALLTVRDVTNWSQGRPY